VNGKTITIGSQTDTVNVGVDCITGRFLTYGANDSAFCISMIHKMGTIIASSPSISEDYNISDGVDSFFQCLNEQFYEGAPQSYFKPSSILTSEKELIGIRWRMLRQTNTSFAPATNNFYNQSFSSAFNLLVYAIDPSKVIYDVPALLAPATDDVHPLHAQMTQSVNNYCSMYYPDITSIGELAKLLGVSLITAGSGPTEYRFAPPQDTLIPEEFVTNTDYEDTTNSGLVFDSPMYAYKSLKILSLTPCSSLNQQMSLLIVRILRFIRCMERLATFMRMVKHL
jgi:hypothetical protein